MTGSPFRGLLVVDDLLVVIALADGLLSLYSTDPLQIIIVTIATLGLLLRRRLPWVSLLLALPALVIASAIVATLVALFSVAVSDPRRWVVAVAAVVVFLASMSTWWGWGESSEVLLSVIYAGMTTAAPVALGILVRTRAELSARLSELDDARRKERARAEKETLEEERARISREMHDVVSHQVSLIAVQAGALQVATADPSSKHAARTIRSLAVRTLDELRQMVAVLRASGEPNGQLAPQPTIADLASLVAESGIPVTLDVDLPSDLPASVQRAVYRTIQEGLTNVRKHAPGSTVAVRAYLRGNSLEAVVRNTAATTSSAKLPSAGHGLIGLRERAELLGGTLSANAERGGAFVLILTIPRVDTARDAR